MGAELYRTLNIQLHRTVGVLTLLFEGGTAKALQTYNEQRDSPSY